MPQKKIKLNNTILSDSQSQSLIDKLERRDVHEPIVYWQKRHQAVKRWRGLDENSNEKTSQKLSSSY